MVILTPSCGAGPGNSTLPLIKGSGVPYRCTIFTLSPIYGLVPKKRRVPRGRALGNANLI
jgi:hypothetical protein